MGKTRENFGYVKAKGFSDGRVRGLVETKTVGICVEHDSVSGLIMCLIKYLISGNKNGADLTVYKKDKRLTVTTRK